MNPQTRAVLRGTADAAGSGTNDAVRAVVADLYTTHSVVIGALGLTIASGLLLFAVNTTTGLWNLWDARGDGSHSIRRTAHVLSMFGANAGFVVTGMMGLQATDRAPSDARTHRKVALSSMVLATTGVALMWF